MQSSCMVAADSPLMQLGCINSRHFVSSQWEPMIGRKFKEIGVCCYIFGVTRHET